jgi:hypothetical protein
MASVPVAGRGHLHCAKRKDVFMSGRTNWRTPNSLLLWAHAFEMNKLAAWSFFSGDRRTRGCIVRSESRELKIRSFLKMFYFAHFSILFLGYFLSFQWSRQIYRALGKARGAHV